MKRIVTMEDNGKKPATDNDAVEELDIGKLESVSGGYPVFRDFSTGKEKEEQKTKEK